MIRVNLQPRVVAEAKEGFQMPIWAPILLGLIIIFGCGGAYWYLNITLNNLESEKQSLEYKLKDFQALLLEFDKVSEDRDYLKEKRDFIEGISSNQAQWTYFFDLLKENTPKDIWIDSLIMDREGEFEVQGETYYYASVGHFILRLEAMPQLSEVSLEAVGVKKTGSAQTGTVEEQMKKRFKITSTSAGLISPPRQLAEERTVPEDEPDTSDEDQDEGQDGEDNDTPGEQEDEDAGEDNAKKPELQAMLR